MASASAWLWPWPGPGLGGPVSCEGSRPPRGADGWGAAPIGDRFNTCCCFLPEERPPPPRAGLVQAVLFEVHDRDLIGHPTPGGHRYCCTKELVPKTKCFQDRLIYQAGALP